MQLVDSATMQAADKRASERIGDVELMRRAGVGIATIIRKQYPNATIVAFAGPGNNGGDAFAACAELARHMPCTVYAQSSEHPSPARKDAELRAQNAGVRIAPLPETRADADALFVDAGLALDGLLGVGARCDTTVFAPLIEALNATPVPVCALDVPTGVDASSGALSAQGAVRATLTIALGLPKTGLIAEPARAHIGALWLVDIGMGNDDIAPTTPPGLSMNILTPQEFLRALPTRARQSDKRSAGAPLIIAGSAQFPGAAILCARGAARAGAGYVTVATPSAATTALRAHLIEQVVVGFDETDIDRAVDDLVDLTRAVKAVGIGPGLGLGPSTAAITRGFLERTSMPVVIDASAFAHISKHLELLRNRLCVLTPHDSEFARLSGKGSIEPGTRLARLREFVERTGITTLLKGDVTLIYDGKSMYFNPTGTSALATAGTGDVLTGMISTLLAQGLLPIEAARLAAYWHGRAGQLAAKERHVGVMAGDLPEILAAAAIIEQPFSGQCITELF